MSNRTDFGVQARELASGWGLGAASTKMLEAELHNAFMAGQENGQRADSQEGLKSRPRLVGIVHVWIRHVRWLGDSGHNRFILPGSVGDLEVSEIGVDGRVINANFHPGGEGNGYGATICPEWEYTKMLLTPYKGNSSESQCRAPELDLAAAWRVEAQRTCEHYWIVGSIERHCSKCGLRQHM